ncbi:MAG: hypothetical protein NTV62_03880 [Candidatus Gribaldobacteria bacterium]|nr:hypothetical protein [Candidatus Gribaldobacteria bacterium]
MDAPKRLLKKIGFSGFFVVSNFPTPKQKDELSVIEMFFALAGAAVVSTAA